MPLVQLKNFITFEGMDGSGKSTVIKNVKEHLEKKGYEVVLTREPGGSALGEKLRDTIKNENMSLSTEIALFNSIRLEHLHKKILPALNENKIVLCDRYLDSTLVYQILAVEDKRLKEELIFNQDLEDIEQVRRELLFKTIDFCSNFNIAIPEKTFFLNTTVETSLKRRDNRGLELDKFENKDVEELTKVRNGYLTIMKDEKIMKGKNRFIEIDANLEQQSVLKQVLNKIDEIYLDLKTEQIKKAKKSFKI